MKELASSFVELIAIVMITITLAISTAALSMWMSADARGATAQPMATSLLTQDAR